MKTHLFIKNGTNKHVIFHFEDFNIKPYISCEPTIEETHIDLLFKRDTKSGAGVAVNKASDYGICKSMGPFVRIAQMKWFGSHYRSGRYMNLETHVMMVSTNSIRIRIQRPTMFPV